MVVTHGLHSRFSTGERQLIWCKWIVQFPSFGKGFQDLIFELREPSLLRGGEPWLRFLMRRDAVVGDTKQQICQHELFDSVRNVIHRYFAIGGRISNPTKRAGKKVR